MNRLFGKSRDNNSLPVRITLGMHIPVGYTKPLFFVLLSLVALAGTIGSVFTFITSCENQGSKLYHHAPVMISIIVSWAIFSVLFALRERLPKVSRAGTVLCVLLLLVYAIIKNKYLTTGFMELANDFMGMVYKKYGEEPMFDPPTIWKGTTFVKADETVTVFMCWASAIISMLCARMVRKPNLILFSSVTFTLVILCLYFGLVPSYLWFLLFIMAWCGAVAAEAVAACGSDMPDARSIFAKTSAQSAAVAAVIMLVSFAGAYIYADVSGFERSEKTEKFRENATEYIRNFTWDKFIADIENSFFAINDNTITHDGKLGTSDSVSFDGSNMLEVTLPKNSDVLYLKGFTASSYSGAKWEEGAAEPVLDTKLTSNHFLSPRILASTPKYNDLQMQNVIVRNTGIMSNTKYIPENAAGLLETNGVRRRYGVYFPQGDWRRYIIDSSSSFSPASSLDKDEDKMREYAYSHCLDVSSQFTAYEEFFENYIGTSLREELMYIRMTLADRCEYTLDAGKKPFGADFAQWFLTENKKGSCTHFATAAIMLCRSRGIPARYCEGFIIHKEDIRNGYDDGSGFVTVSVPDNRAHAWAEIYLDGYGWTVYEFTPGYGNVAVTETDDADTETETSVITSVETSAPLFTENMNTTAITTTYEAPTETVLTEDTAVNESDKSETSVEDGAETSVESENTTAVETTYDSEGSYGIGQNGGYTEQTTVTGSYPPDQTETARQSGTDDEGYDDNAGGETGGSPSVPEEMPKAVKAILLFLGAVLLLTGLYFAVRYLVFMRRRKLAGDAPDRAAIEIYHMLLRHGNISTEDVPADELALHIVRETGIDADAAEMIVSSALCARFGQGISSDEAGNVCTSYKKAIKTLTDNKKVREIIAVILMYDRYI